MTLSLTKTISFDNRDELLQENPIKIVTSDEIVTENLLTKEQLSESNPNDTIPKTIQDKNRDINLVKFSECDNLVKKETALCETKQKTAIVNITANVSSHGMTSTIPIVVCTISDSDPKRMDVDNDNSDGDYATDGVRIEQNFNILTTTDEKCIPQEELSPTTDEYQECCPPADYQYDISTEGEILAPGCVAPTPTPAPSIAPLAEVEVDPPEDELETDEVESILVSGEAPNEANKNVVKKEADGTSGVEKDVADTHGEESQCRNAVCPWEDE